MPSILLLSNGLPTLVDDDVVEHYSRWPWHAHGQPPYVYAAGTGRGGKTVYLHRLIAGARPGEVVDHLNHDTLDNRRVNLKRCSHAENMRNRRGAQVNSKSGVRNVQPNHNHWQVNVKVNGQKHYIGTYKTIEEAEAAAIAARRRLHRRWGPRRIGL